MDVKFGGDEEAVLSIDKFDGFKKEVPKKGRKGKG